MERDRNGRNTFFLVRMMTKWLKQWILSLELNLLFIIYRRKQIMFQFRFSLIYHNRTQNLWIIWRTEITFDDPSKIVSSFFSDPIWHLWLIEDQKSNHRTRGNNKIRRKIVEFSTMTNLKDLLPSSHDDNINFNVLFC